MKMKQRNSSLAFTMQDLESNELLENLVPKKENSNQPLIFPK